MKLLKIIKPIFKSTTYRKAIRFYFYRAISIISMASKMAKADWGPLGIRMVTLTNSPYTFILKVISQVITLRNGF